MTQPRVAAAAIALAAAATAAAIVATANPAPRIAWPAPSWETLPVFAFPGAAPRFMNATEVAYFTANFPLMLIWGLNSTCAGPDGTVFPPACANSRCYCDANHPETQRWVLNMEVSLQEQGRRLKASAAAGNAYPVLGYIEGLSAQQYYVAQAALWQNATLNTTEYQLAVASRGLIDCYVDGCNWQGVEYRQYDLRSDAMRAYYVDTVVGSLISSPHLDGTFLDSIDWWASQACGMWRCTAAELASLTNASLAALDEVLALAESLGKVISVSSHTSMGVLPSYWSQYAAILAAHPSASARFYEFWGLSSDMLATAMYESLTLGLQMHVHTPTKTLSPDWAELAQFLLVANERSYFSYSGPWMLDSFVWQPEFSQKLGAPLGGPYNQSQAIAHGPWALVNGTNLITGLPVAPGKGNPGWVDFLGNTTSAADCLALTLAAPLGRNYTAMTWVTPAEPQWGSGYYARYDAFQTHCAVNFNLSMPCFSSQQPTTVSAIAQPYTANVTMVRRDFQHLNVSLSLATGEAHLTWLAG